MFMVRTILFLCFIGFNIFLVKASGDVSKSSVSEESVISQAHLVLRSKPISYNLLLPVYHHPVYEEINNSKVVVKSPKKVLLCWQITQPCAGSNTDHFSVYHSSQGYKSGSRDLIIRLRKLLI